MQTRSVARPLAALALALSVLAGACAGDDDAEPTSTTEASPTTALQVVEDGVDGALGDRLRTAVEVGHGEVSAPGAIVAVRTSDGTWVATIGSARLGADEAMSRGMHQRVGSVTKTFTSTVLLQLAGEDALSLDTPISQYVPGTPNPEATLGQLSAMRSGIPSYTQTDVFATGYFADPARRWEPQELVDLVAGAEPQFAPGTDYYYSNTNIVLLGLVIEQVTGQPIDEVMAERIIEPLGLTGTRFPTDAAFPDPHPDGYTLQGQDDAVPADTTDWNPSWAWTAGGMISTADDLLTYSEQLALGGDLLDPEMQAVRLASLEDMVAGDPDRTYGYGLQQVNGWYGHTGELPGFNTFMYHHTDADLTVVVLVNSDIKSGACQPTDPTLPGGRTTGPCFDPAVHIANFVTAALGHPGTPQDQGPFAPAPAPTTTAPPG